MNNDRKSKIPAAPTIATSGNLLSNVAPPTELPNFVSSTPVAPTPNPPVPKIAEVVQAHTIPPSQLPPTSQNIGPKPDQPSPESPEKFSPAIPLCKGEPTLPIRSPDDSLTTLSPESMPDSTPEMEKIGSGGDMIVVVASDKETKVSPVREAFQTVFGKATVIGYPAQSDVTAEQPVSYAAAYAAAKQRIAYIRSVHSELTNNVPVLAIEDFIQETVTDRWYDLALLVLSQPSLGIELQVQSQATPVPAAAVAAAQAATKDDYTHAQTGFSVTIGSIMGTNLQVPHTQWQEASTGVSRREILLLAAKSIAGSYKKLLAVSAAEE
ncbi:protein PRRC1-like isoform X2 [Maniola hyperantus]|uniref:protein PRRC1-like isoform X2 n=1 Tax=Aphantopus hyperantus TaxID=2795564 RepID=UPI00214411F5